MQLVIFPDMASEGILRLLLHRTLCLLSLLQAERKQSHQCFSVISSFDAAAKNKHRGQYKTSVHASCKDKSGYFWDPS